MSKNYTKIPGVRLKFRTFHLEGTEPLWASATVWKDDEQICEIATMRIGDKAAPCAHDLYHAWVDAVSAIFHAELSAATGIPGIVGRRQKPSYKGER